MKKYIQFYLFNKLVIYELEELNINYTLIHAIIVNLEQVNWH